MSMPMRDMCEVMSAWWLTSHVDSFVFYVIADRVA